MSAIGGIYNLDGAPVDEQLLSQLGNRLNLRGPDGGREIVYASIGMTYRAFHTNKESRLENQPLVSANQMLLCWDGRLDNREELISLLRSELKGVHTDVSIVMAAYDKWGLDFLPRIIGDFALSLWDPRTRTLLLARDPIGPRTLYYHADMNRIIWSSELSALLEDTEIEPKINEEYIADFLTRLPDPGHTPYEKLLAVPPGAAVITNSGQPRVHTFWKLNPNYSIRYRTDAEYEEHFRHLFREAILCRLRIDGPALAELSGGLDSSAIVCMADELIKAGDAEAFSLETVSKVYDEAYKSDERKYIHYVEEKVNRRGHYIREDDYRIFAPLPLAYRPIIPNPVCNFAQYYIALNELMRSKRVPVLLSGKGGDEILSSAQDPAPEFGDLLVKGRLFQLAYRVNVWSKVLDQPYFRILWRRAVWPMLPLKLQVFLSLAPEKKILKLYDREYARRMNFRERRLGPLDAFGFRYPSSRDQAKWFLRVIRELSAGYWREFILCADISYPFTHRPLIEFMQAIPFEQRVRPGESRSLLRRALRGLLPSEILRRKGKTLNTDAVFRAAAREWPRFRELLLSPNARIKKYVDSKELILTFELAVQNHDSSALSLAFLIPLECWLRSLGPSEGTAYQNNCDDQCDKSDIANVGQNISWQSKGLGISRT